MSTKDEQRFEPASAAAAVAQSLKEAGATCYAQLGETDKSLHYHGQAGQIRARASSSE